MSLTQELTSWLAPSTKQISSPPTPGSNAPSSEKLPFPARNGKSTLITFLRHCGCPFAESTFRAFRAAAAEHPELNFVAISHSDDSATQKWLDAIGGPTENPGAPSVQVIVDAERDVYAQWGLGTSSWLHVLSPPALMSVVTLGRTRGIWNRPTESGSRWQTAGSWAVDAEGVVRWGGPAGRADEVVDWEEALKAVGGGQ